MNCHEFFNRHSWSQRMNPTDCDDPIASSTMCYIFLVKFLDNFWIYCPEMFCGEGKNFGEPSGHVDWRSRLKDDLLYL